MPPKKTLHQSEQRGQRRRGGRGRKPQPPPTHHAAGRAARGHQVPPDAEGATAPAPAPSHRTLDTRQQSALPREPAHHRNSFPRCLCPKRWRLIPSARQPPASTSKKASSALYGPQAAERRPPQEGPAQAPGPRGASNRAQSSQSQQSAGPQTPHQEVTPDTEEL